MALTVLPKITPSKGTVFFMAAFLATFSYFSLERLLRRKYQIAKKQIKT